MYYHNNCKDKHNRSSKAYPYYHLKGLLNILNICC